MTTIYDQHDKAFSNVSAFVVALEGKRVATIAFKFPRDGAGRLYAYVHWLGEPMVRGFAGGYGYDKRSAACSSAAHKLVAPHETQAREVGWRTGDLTGPKCLVLEPARFADANGQHPYAGNWEEACAIYSGTKETLAAWTWFRDALTPDDGETWDSRLRKAGFEIWQAV